MPTANDALLSDLETIFADSGPLAALMPQYRRNSLQVEYARQTVLSMTAPPDSRGSPVTMIEAGTGSGKTIGYLVALGLVHARTGSRGLVSTYTNHLSKQILDHDAPKALSAVAAVTGIRPTIARRIGRRNFIDRSRLLALIDDLRAENPSANADALQALKDLYDSRHSSLIEAAADGLTLPASVPPTLIQLTATSSDEDQEPYRNHTEEGSSADILVVNHTIMAVNTLYRQAEEDADPRHVVFDEADMMENAASSLAQMQMPLSTLSSLCNSILSTGSLKQAEECIDLVKTIAAKSIQNRAGIVTPKSPLKPCIPPLVRVERLLRKELHRNRTANRSGIDITAAETEIDNLGRWINTTEPTGDRTSIISLSPVRNRPSLTLYDSRPAKLFTRLWRPNAEGKTRCLSATLTSATLSTPTLISRAEGDFTETERSLYITDRFDNRRRDLDRCLEPADFGSMKIVLADRSVPSPSRQNDEDGLGGSNPAWLEYVSDAIRDIAKKRERTLILTTSFADTEEIAARLDETSCTILKHRRGQSLAALVELYRRTPNAIMITPSGWYGLDLPGLIDHLVITRIPFLMTNQTNVEALEYLLSAANRPGQASHIIRSVNERRTRRKLRQGIGRTPRAKTDSATLYILDPRFPLPDSLTMNPRKRLSQNLASKNLSMLSTIPARFRNHETSPLENAEIYPATKKVSSRKSKR